MAKGGDRKNYKSVDNSGIQEGFTKSVGERNSKIRAVGVFFAGGGEGGCETFLKSTMVSLHYSFPMICLKTSDKLHSLQMAR